MKILIIYLVTLPLFAFSQTKLLAHKSHSGSSNDIHISSSGNFGLPDLSIDSVLFENQCIVVVTSYGGFMGHKHAEPICDSPYLRGEIDFETFQKEFPSETIFSGFPEEKKIKENNLFLIALIFMLSALVQFIRQKRTLFSFRNQ